MLTGNLSFGDPPMLVGDAIQKAAADEVGAANFVTAVVLAYRGLDTLGELSILFAAATAGGLVLGSAQGGSHRRPAGFILRAGTDLLFPLLLVVGLYIVMHGHLTPGRRFSGWRGTGRRLFPAAAGTPAARRSATPGCHWSRGWPVPPSSRSACAGAAAMTRHF